MVKFSALLFAATGIVSVLSAALPMEKRQAPSGDVYCGNNDYSPDAVADAINTGYQLYQDGQTLGKDQYPHQYYDYADENIQLYCSGSTWYEFPIMANGEEYSGGSPSTDRVIFDDSGNYCAVVTHTGAATYNGFTACQGD